jgi:hypothetical protein
MKNKQINVSLYGDVDRDYSCEQKGNIGDFLDRRGIFVLINFKKFWTSVVSIYVIEFFQCFFFCISSYSSLIFTPYNREI